MIDLESIDIEFYVKIIGALAVLVKLRDSFASIKRKQELKLDLEILEKLRVNENLNTFQIEEKINKKLLKAFEDKSESLTNFFTGIAVFVGFGFWSYDIYKSSNSFNGWIILTLLCSLIGLSLVFDNGSNTKEKEIFYKIGLFDKENFKYSIIITFLFGIITAYLILKIDGYLYWKFFTGLFFLIGLTTIFKNIKKL